jgi:hypothetical protein
VCVCVCVCMCIYIYTYIYIYTLTHLCHLVCEEVVALVAIVPGWQTVGSRDDVVIVSAANEKLWEPG